MMDETKLLVTVKDHKITLNKKPMVAYYAGFWLTEDIFKGLKIFPGSFKA